MRPTLTIDCRRHRALGYAIAFGQCDFGDARLCQFSCIYYNSLRQFGLWVLGAMQYMKALFRCGIQHIDTVCTQKQMAWIIATRVIALVAYLHSIWDCAVGQYISKAMRPHILAIEVNSAVTTFENANVWTPYPAFIWTTNSNATPVSVVPFAPFARCRLVCVHVNSYGKQLIQLIQL